LHFAQPHYHARHSLGQVLDLNPFSLQSRLLGNIWAMENASLVPSVLSGDVAGVSFKRVKIANKWAATDLDIPMNVESGAKNASYSQTEHAPRASFTFAPGALSPGKKVTFDASSSVAPGGEPASYQWLFGDGTAANGVHVRQSSLIRLARFWTDRAVSEFF